MTTDLSGAQRELEDARRERAELDELIGALEGQVRAGEAADAERELTAQYGLQRLAQLRAEAAEQRVRDAEAAERLERRQAAVRAAQAELEALSPERLADACWEALEAFERVQALGDARQAAVERHAAVFVDLGMDDLVRHRDGSWVVYEVGGVRYDTSQDNLDGRALLAAVEGERRRRTQVPGRRAQGYSGPEPERHRMSLLLARRTTENEEAA